MNDEANTQQLAASAEALSGAIIDMLANTGAINECGAMACAAAASTCLATLLPEQPAADAAERLGRLGMYLTESTLNDVGLRAPPPTPAELSLPKAVTVPFVPAAGELYVHHKGGLYEVLALAQHADDRSFTAVVYRALADGRVWWHWLHDFVRVIDAEGTLRFRPEQPGEALPSAAEDQHGPAH